MLINNIVLFGLLTILCTPSDAQASSNASTLSDSCECFPSCTNPKGSLNCNNGRSAPREDCSCCEVCLRQEGEVCQVPENPCDEELGLTCSPRGICQVDLSNAKLSKGSKCKVDEECPSHLFCLGDKCSNPCTLLQPCDGHLKGGKCITRNHQPKCECPEGSTANYEVKACLPIDGDVKSADRTEKDSKLQGKFSAKAEAIHVKHSTQNSTTLILPTAAGGIIHYKESRADIEASKKAVDEGEKEVTVTGLSPSTRYTFKWVGNDGTGAKSEIKTEDGCRHSGISYPVGAKWHEGCQTTCSCHIGGVSECRPRCIFLAGAVQDEQCEERPSPTDPECCVEYNCEKGDNSVLDALPVIGGPSGVTQIGQPKLIVTSRTHNSATVAWDDFRAGDPNTGYVTEYREVPAVAIETEIPWMKKETSTEHPPPTMTLGNLKPNTLYEVRVGLYSHDKEQQLNAGTETITVRTEPGCVYGNTSFGVGEFFQGCEERCSCSKDGSVKCSKRCSIPYFKRGTFDSDPYCTEDKEDSDECCALVMCAHGGNRGSEDKILLDFDQCANTVCGNNAECVSWPTLSEASGGQGAPHPGSCRCKEGYSGDPTDLINGCVLDPDAVLENNSCNFKSKLYSPGDVFYDGCSYSCTCNSQREIECQARCKFPSDAVISDPGCTFIPDPEDSCCLIRVCNSTHDNESSAVVSSPSLITNGCFYGNRTYAKDEEFIVGCESKCLCMGFGDVSCLPRCPPQQDSMEVGVKCETLLDPEDKCCNVTVCDVVAPEVMRSNVSDDEPLFETTTMDNVDDKTSMTVAELAERKANKSLEESEMVVTEETVTPMVDKMDSIADHTEQIMGNDTMIDKETIMETEARHSVHKIGETVETTTLPFSGITEESFGVTHEVNETAMLMKRPRLEEIANPSVEIVGLVPVDSSTVKMTVKVTQNILSHLLSAPTEYVVVSYSHDSLTWTNRTISVDDIQVQNMNELVFTIPDLEAYDAYQFRAIYRDYVSPTKKIALTSSSVISDSKSVRHDMCEFKGNFYKPGENFYDDCVQYCQCTEDLKVHCGLIECPRHFGLDILDPGCLEWEDDPEYVATPPRCCGQKPKCTLHIDHLSCTHLGHSFQHLDFLPQEMVGCDQQCQCLSGKIDCENLCSPVQATPPFHLPCRPSEARLVSLDTFPCCREWQCERSSEPGSSQPHPSSIPYPPIHVGGPPAPQPGISLPEVENLSDDTVIISFKIPNTFVGLPAGIYLRYTPDRISNPNPLHWESEVIHEDGITVDQQHWEYVKRNLAPGTNYTMQLVLSTHLAKKEITSPNFEVSTPAGEMEQVDLPVDLELRVSEISNSSVRISWTSISDRNLQEIDGIVIRYWTKSDVFPLETPVLHRTATYTILHHLKLGTSYTADLQLNPREGSQVRIISPHNVTFETLPDLTDKATTPLPHLDLDAELTVSDISNNSAKISWKHFSDFELQYIDGIRVRFWRGNKRFPEEGPMLHREADNMVLRDLEPGTRYTVDLFFIPHGGLMTTISNTRNITFSTMPKLKDKYAFNITIAPGKVSEAGVEILYSGVAEPEGKYINVYRVVYTSDGDSEDSQKFKVPKNQKDGYIRLTDLKPGVQYEVWLEAYLTNGGKKKSNVITVMTEYDTAPQLEKSEIIASKELKQENVGSYYSAFVAVAILVAIACLIILTLLFVLLRRQNHAKAHISSTKRAGAYDNPSYKTSENNYAMEMNGLKNTTNGSSLPAEEP